jgi:hypothetical protein
VQILFSGMWVKYFAFLAETVENIEIRENMITALPL